MALIIKSELKEIAKLLEYPCRSSVPFDVTFEIVENETDKETNKKEIKAHKIIVAAQSPVFEGMFYGSMKEEKDVIQVKQTTFSDFEKLIQFFYQVDIDSTEMSVFELFGLAMLADRYQVSKLTDELKRQMENFPITMTNLMEIASTAKEYHMLEDVSKVLLLNCAKVLQKNVGLVGGGQQFALEEHISSDRGLLALDLLKLVQSLPSIACDNCEEGICQNGNQVTHDKLRNGLKVKVDATHSYWGQNNLASVAIKRFTVVGAVGSDTVALTEEGSVSVYTYKSMSQGRDGWITPTLCYRC